MTWNFRVMRHVGLDQEVTYGFVEAYYLSRGHTIPHSWSEDYTAPMGGTMSELGADLNRMRDAMKKPVLNDDGTEMV